MHWLDKELSLQRTGIGTFFITLGVGMLLLGIIDRKELWVGVRKQVVHDVTIQYVNPPTPTHPTLPSNQHYLPNMSVEIQWEYTANHSPDGTYQLRNERNVITMIKFCEPAPTIPLKTVINLTYQDGNSEGDCKAFINAEVIKE